MLQESWVCLGVDASQSGTWILRCRLPVGNHYHALRSRCLLLGHLDHEVSTPQGTMILKANLERTNRILFGELCLQEASDELSSLTAVEAHERNICSSDLKVHQGTESGLWNRPLG